MDGVEFAQSSLSCGFVQPFSRVYALPHGDLQLRSNDCDVSLHGWREGVEGGREGGGGKVGGGGGRE